MSPLATLANGPTSRSLRQVPSATFRTTKWALFESNVAQPAGSDYFQAGLYIEHIPTGLFAYGAYGHLDPDSVFVANDAANNTWYAKGGIRQRWTPLGHTVLYGEYLRAENNNSAPCLDAQRYGNVTAVAISVRTSWRKHVSRSGVLVLSRKSTLLRCRYGSSTATSRLIPLAPTPLATDDFDYVGTGALINF